MYLVPIDPKRILLAIAMAVVTTLAATVAVDAIYFTTHPGSPTESGISTELWGEIDGGSLTTMHRGEATDDVLDVSYTMADTIEGWLKAVAEGGVIGDPVGG